MEKEVAVKEWCIEKAIQMNHGLGKPAQILSTAKLLEEYLAGRVDVELESFDGFEIECKPKK